MIAISRALGCVALGVALLASASAFGQGESKKNCGPGRRPGINGCVDAAPRARLKPDPAKVGDPKPQAPEQRLRPLPVERTRDEVAERALLMQELDRLEKLLTLTPKTAPERAAIVKRLAEAYAELARHAEYDRDVARIRAERAQQEEKANPKARRRPRAPTRM